jgi:hypothetical protein
MLVNKKYLELILFLFSFSIVFSQEKLSPEKSFIGKWKVVYSSKKIDSVDKKGFTSYEFFDTGICRAFSSDRKCNSKLVEYLDYNWKISKNTLSFEEAAWCNGFSKLPDYNNIKWVNDSLFYSAGKEGMRKIYTYFRKQ